MALENLVARRRASPARSRAELPRIGRAYFFIVPAPPDNFACGISGKPLRSARMSFSLGLSLEPTAGRL